jgi:hypothetical protein
MIVRRVKGMKNFSGNVDDIVASIHHTAVINKRATAFPGIVTGDDKYIQKQSIDM